jgi:hypothetical protein
MKLQWKEYATFKIIMVSRLISMTKGTFLIEHPSQIHFTALHLIKTLLPVGVKGVNSLLIIYATKHT